MEYQRYLNNQKKTGKGIQRNKNTGNNTMIELNPNILLITLNVSGLNAQI